MSNISIDQDIQYYQQMQKWETGNWKLETETKNMELGFWRNSGGLAAGECFLPQRHEAIYGLEQRGGGGRRR
jgi:hypothetical protein